MKPSRPIQFILATLILNLSCVLHAQPAATNQWQLSLSHFAGESSPAIAQDGTIYQATFDGRLLAITPSGQIKWTFKTRYEIKSSPAIADDGTIYFGSRDRKFYAVTPGGDVKWTFPTGAWVDSSPAIGADGTVYFGSWDKQFYALKPDGTLKWIFATSNIVVSSPAIATDGTIYFGSHDQKLYALNPDGTLRWTFSTGAPIISSPALAGNGTIYFTSTDGYLYALKPDGTEQWRLHTGGFTESSPVLSQSGQIFLGVNSFRASVSDDGRKLLDYGSPNPIDYSPVAAANGLVYFTTSWGELSAFNNREQAVWTVQFGKGLFPNDSPAIDANGVIYFGDGRNLYSFVATNSAPLAGSSWPMFHANARHTGRAGGN